MFLANSNWCSVKSPLERGGAVIGDGVCEAQELQLVV